MHNLFLQELPSSEGINSTPSAVKRQNLGSGDWPVWSTDGETILTILHAPNRTYLTAYPAHHPGLALPTIELNGEVYGLSWRNISLSSSIQSIYEQAALVTPTPLYLPSVTSIPDDNGGRYQLMPLTGVTAPHPYLHDMVDDSFQALRTRIAVESGWDFLASLENAYVPLTAPLDPGMGNDWLYTGRAFTLNTLPMNADWLVVVRDDFAEGTYWRVYIKALYQDGSAGMPLHDQPWDFDARYNGDTIIYEQGGENQASIPAGYWIDFTERAQSFGWERLPALVTWRASSPAARFNEFVFTGGEDWQPAMLELYPPEAMITPTPVIPPTRTPTITSRWYVSPTPTHNTFATPHLYTVYLPDQEPDPRWMTWQIDLIPLYMYASSEHIRRFSRRPKAILHQIGLGALAILFTACQTSTPTSTTPDFISTDAQTPQASATVTEPAVPTADTTLSTQAPVSPGLSPTVPGDPDTRDPAIY